MAKPITNGTLQTNIHDMIEGDYIAARYTAEALNIPGVFSELGTVDTDNVDIWNASTNPLDGYVYLIKIAKGTLMCTSLTVQNITSVDVNKYNCISGNVYRIDGNEVLVRVPNLEEYMAAHSNLNGMLDAANISNNFFTESGNYSTRAEIAQHKVRIYSTLYNTYYTWGSFPGTPNNLGSSYGDPWNIRFVIIYKDNSNSVDVFH